MYKFFFAPCFFCWKGNVYIFPIILLEGRGIYVYSSVLEKDPRGSKVLDRLVSTSEIKAGKEQFHHDVYSLYLAFL